ncbi:MAG: transglycosylase domain-containing protein [Myxococcota bacterium]
MPHRPYRPGGIVYQPDGSASTEFSPPPPSGRTTLKQRSAPPQPRRWRWLRAVGLVCVVGLALLSATLFVGRAWVEATIAEQLQSQAQARGWSVAWTELELGFDLTLQIDGLKAQHGPSSIALPSTTVVWTLADLFRGRMAPDTIRIEGPKARLDIEALRHQLSAAPNTAQRSSSSSSSWAQRLKHELERSRIHIEHGSVQLRHIPKRSEPILMEDFSLHGAPKEAQTWMATWDATCVEGCGSPQQTKGRITHRPGSWQAVVGLEKALEVELPISAENRLVASIQQLSAEMSRGQLTVGARDVTLPIASKHVRGTLVVEAITLTHPEQPQRRSITLQRPRFKGYRPAVAPAPSDHDDEHGSVLQGEAHPPAGASLFDIPTPFSIRTLIAEVAPKLGPVRVRDGTVHLTRTQLHLTEIHAEPRGAAYRVGGILNNKGRIAFEIQPQVPHVVVELEKMPMQPFAARYIPRIGDRIGGLVSGQVRLDLDQPSADEPGVYRADGRLVVEEGMFNHPKITPVGIVQERLGVEFTGSYRPLFGSLDDRLDIRSLALDFPSRVRGRTARLNVTGDIENLLGSARSEDEKLRWHSRFWLDETPCDIAIGAIPRGMIPHLWKHIRATGSFAPSVTLNIDLANPYELEFDVQGLPGSCRLLSLGTYSPRYLDEPFRQEVREGVSRRGIYVGPTSGHYAHIWQIPRHVTAAMYITEESAFYSNPGFSVSLIRRAIRLNFDRMRYVYGGSSIEQQLVKNMFMTRQKTLSRKLEEAFIVWRMGDLLTKDRIIELYMNCIEFGPNLYGIVRASWFYFGKPPYKLTPLEGVFLAAIKPSPLNGVSVKRTGHTPTGGWWHKRIAGTMRKLYERGFINREQYLDAYPFVLYFPGHQPSDEADAAQEQTRPEDEL